MWRGEEEGRARRGGDEKCVCHRCRCINTTSSVVLNCTASVPSQGDIVGPAAFEGQPWRVVYQLGAAAVTSLLLLFSRSVEAAFVASSGLLLLSMGCGVASVPSGSLLLLSWGGGGGGEEVSTG